MAEHAYKVSEMINAPSMTDLVQDSMITGGNALLDGSMVKQHEEYHNNQRQTQVNELKDLNMQIELNRVNNALEKSIPIGEGELANVQ